MKMIATLFFVGLVAAMTDAELKAAKLDVREGMINEPGLSFNSLANDDLVTKHWKTALTSVFLKDKLVLSPELGMVNGYAASNYVSTTEFNRLYSNLNQTISKLWSISRSEISAKPM